MVLAWGPLGKTSFKPDTDIPDLSGKAIIVTGGESSLSSLNCVCSASIAGNVGLGKETVLQLAKHNPKIYLAARTPSKAKDTIASIKEQVPNADITFLELDLTSLASVKKAAETFTASSQRLDILINNAGVMAQPPGLTKDGYELQFGTNHVGHFLFTNLLLPTLQKTAAEPNADVRIINLSSAGHMMPPSGGFLPNEVVTNMETYNTWKRYGQSKLANILFTRELARRYPEIKSVAVHPGSVETNLANGFLEAHPWLNMLARYVTRIISVQAEQGALNQLWCATSKEAESGEYYNPVAQKSSGSGYSRDRELAEKLWSWSEEQLKEKGY